MRDRRRVRFGRGGAVCAQARELRPKDAPAQDAVGANGGAWAPIEPAEARIIVDYLTRNYRNPG